jgi:hypothetical protein
MELLRRRRVAGARRVAVPLVRGPRLAADRDRHVLGVVVVVVAVVVVVVVVSGVFVTIVVTTVEPPVVTVETMVDVACKLNGPFPGDSAQRQRNLHA